MEQEIAADELTKQIDCFLATLDEESQMLFVRRYWYSDGISDLAERFHASNNNVSVRLSRIRNEKYYKDWNLYPSSQGLSVKKDIIS